MRALAVKAVNLVLALAVEKGAAKPLFYVGQMRYQSSVSPYGFSSISGLVYGLS
ncbi:hypothetical protein HMPREF9080_01780 [Cardiobacterium valvarum F0432]|uniref:Uncharacterized protein n=1 Tax=Cardiobacterium valvarum F0432 TaxID=797473 RepID=G9ZG77_9GAMM|nr:hypothetical protein HMPREF9080_01780 [Cardiobacterium valvarum F0432]